MRLELKLRFYGRLRPLFPEWVLTRQIGVIQRAQDAELAKAKAQKNEAEYRRLLDRQQFEGREYWEELEALRSEKLCGEARRFFIHMSDLEWETGNFGHRYLNSTSESVLYRAVREEKAKVRDQRIKLVTAVTGFLGALTGLVAILKK